MTNYKRIEEMSIDAMAKWLEGNNLHTDCTTCIHVGSRSSHFNCAAGRKAWLEQGIDHALPEQIGENEMTHGFEKYFPLPFHFRNQQIYSGEYTAAWVLGVSPFPGEKIRGVTLKDDTQISASLGRYLTVCANLMPEMMEALKNTAEMLRSVMCYRCYRANCDKCQSCQALDKARDVLAKLEGGNANE